MNNEDSKRNREERIMSGIRWTARIGGTGIIGLVALIMIGHGFDPLSLTGIESAMMVALLTSLVGMAILWRWEGIGGALAIVGIASFYVLNLSASGGFPGGWVFPLCFVPGVLALVCWMRETERKQVH